MTRQIKHRNVSSIWLYNFTQFEAFSQDRNRILFLSMMDMNLIWNAIQNINLLQTRVYTEAEDQLYTMVDDAQFETFQRWVSDLRNHLGEYLVTNELLAQIVEQLEALVNKPCCPDAGTGSGSRGSGGTAQPPIGYNQEETPEEPPAGFETMEEFLSVKCNASQDLLNALRGDLLGIAGLNYSGLTINRVIEIFVGLLITPIPFDEIIGLAGYLVYASYSYTFLAQMSAELFERNNELLCLLYTSPTSEAAKTNLLAAIEAIALSEMPDAGTAEWVMGAIVYMLPFDATNKLFQNLPTIAQSADCSACGDVAIAQVTSFYCEATLLDGDFSSGNIVELQSCVSGSEIVGAIRHQVAIASVVPDANIRIEVIDISTGDYIVNAEDNGTPVTLETYANAAALIGYDENRSAWQVARWITDVDTVPFTVQIRVTTL